MRTLLSEEVHKQRSLTGIKEGVSIHFALQIAVKFTIGVLLVPLFRPASEDEFSEGRTGFSGVASCLR